MQESQKNITYEKVKETDMVKGRYNTLDRTIDRLFQILYIPSFDAHESWEVFRKVSRLKDTYFLVKSTYFEATDVKEVNCKEELNQDRLSAPFWNPMMMRQIVDIDKQYISQVLTKIKELKISPMACNGAMGCDGARYHIIFENGTLRSHYSWWESGTVEWRELINIVIKLIEDLNEIAKV